MIKSYLFKLNPGSPERIINNTAYKIYSCLLNEIEDPAFVELLHEDAVKPVNSCVFYDRDLKQNYWRINLLNDGAIEHFSPVLSELTELDLHHETLMVHKVREVVTDSQELIARSVNGIIQSFTIDFLSPTSFKSNERYVLIPTIDLIIQSLQTRWNFFNPDFLIDESEVTNLMTNHIELTNYNLHSVRYKLKQNYIPGFMGRIVYRPHLMIAINKLLSILLSYADYSGIGIKTALGMGGIEATIKMNAAIT